MRRRLNSQGSGQEEDLSTEFDTMVEESPQHCNVEQSSENIGTSPGVPVEDSDRGSCTQSSSPNAEERPLDAFQMIFAIEDLLTDAVEVFFDCEDDSNDDENTENRSEEHIEPEFVHTLPPQSSSQQPPRCETSTSSFDYDHLVGGDGNLPIFPGLSCTKGQLVSLVLAYHLRFPNTKESLQGLLQLLNTIVPGCIRSTKYFFDRYFFGGFKAFETHFVCPTCFVYLGKEKANYCSACQKMFSAADCKKDGAFILTKSIEGQLKDMLESGGLWNCIENRSIYNEGNYGELYSGNLYKDVDIQTFLKSGDNFTLTFSTDGVQVFKSSKYQIWPIMCSINEIDSRHKSRFMVLHTLWFGLSKLRADTFLKAFVDEARDLFFNGIEWTDAQGLMRLSKVIFPVAIADAPARALLLERMQFNAEYGCDFCEHPGVNIAKGLGRVQVFPMQAELPRLRTKETTLRYAEIAAESGFPVMGIKGPTILAALFGFDVSKSVIPDAMHCCWLGIVVQFRKLWETSTDKPFYIPNMNKRIDKYLCGIKVPTEIIRAPRSLELFGSDWKASENRSFCLFFSPVLLKDLLSLEYYEHWMLFVNGCRCLLRKPVTEENRKIASKLFDKFIFLVPTLYGEENVSYNIHILQHIPEAVQNWGAPWATSAFLFEDAGGDLIHQFHGTRYVSEQIFSNFLSKAKLKRYSTRYMENADEDISKLFKSFNFAVQYEEHGVKLLGKGSPDVFDAHLQSALSEYFVEKFGENCTCDTILCYERASYKGKVYCTERYCANLQRDNSIVQLNCNAVHVIKKIAQINHDSACMVDDSVLFIGEKLEVSSIRSHLDTHSGLDLTQFIKKIDRVRRTPICGVFSHDDIKNKGFRIGNETGNFILFYDVNVERG